MSNNSELRAMLEDGTEMQTLARSLLDISERMVAYAKNMLDEDDDGEEESSMDEEDSMPSKKGKNAAKDMAILSLKKKK